MTTENPPVAYTQFLHQQHSLHLRKTDSAFSSIHYSPLRVGGLFAANGSLLSLQPADLLAPLTDPTLLALCRLGLLLRSLRQIRSLSPPSGMTTVATGQVLLAGSSPAGLAASFAAPSGSPVIQEKIEISRLLPPLDRWTTPKGSNRVSSVKLNAIPKHVKFARLAIRGSQFLFSRG